MNYGDLGKRFVAAILDYFIIAIGAFFLAWIALPVVLVGAPLIVILYDVLMEGGSWHATLGKKIMGLYVADSYGNGISYSTALLRWLGKRFLSPIFLIGFIMALFSDEKQCLHDRLAKTFVLNGEPTGAVRPVGGGGVVADADLPELVGITGPLAGMTYKMHKNGLVMGRDSVGCQVIIPSNQAKVSRVHCFVTFNASSGMFVLNDRNSTHGTFLADGTRVSYSQPMALRSGDRFYLATPENTFEVR